MGMKKRYSANLSSLLAGISKVPAALDVRVTLVEPRDSFLDFIDKTLIAEFIQQIREMGVDLRLGSKVELVEDKGKVCTKV